MALTWALGVVYNVFESVDVVTLIKGGVYDDLSLTVGEALKKRSPVCDLPLMTYCVCAYDLSGIPGHLYLLSQRWIGHHL